MCKTRVEKHLRARQFGKAEFPFVSNIFRLTDVFESLGRKNVCLPVKKTTYVSVSRKLFSSSICICLCDILLLYNENRVGQSSLIEQMFHQLDIRVYIRNALNCVCVHYCMRTATVYMSRTLHRCCVALRVVH